ncbi:hypothetical protein D9756_003556 [Leucocoprinus leucothites]|uniref:Uncharacterized protein n=1 Tax=Leucocoprinus leucothites TaxID=201217 RepID=A0A8H5G6X4_9AGAR|nr:hypothetical protein D9756_003556 [Leucoagaricus leucothites]
MKSDPVLFGSEIFFSFWSSPGINSTIKRTQLDLCDASLVSREALRPVPRQASPLTPSRSPASRHKSPLHIYKLVAVTNERRVCYPTPSPYHLPSTPSRMTKKLSEDTWNANPPQVTSYLAYNKARSLNDKIVYYMSPNCGLGWRFQIKGTSQQAIISDGCVQESTSQLDVTFQPHMCSSMPLSPVRVNVKVSYPSNGTPATQESVFADVSVKSDQFVGSYRTPPRYEGQVHIEITLTFSDSDGLSFPTTSPPNAAAALQQSLEAASFVDSKFYLFSSKLRGRPARPRAVFAKSTLLIDRSAYLRDLLSEMTPENSTPCDLREDVIEEINKLDADAFDYEHDSDLEDDTEDVDGPTINGEKITPTSQSPLATTPRGQPSKQQSKPLGHVQDGRAFAINGTAYKTWKAFVYYTYTNKIHFNELKSQRGGVSSTSSADFTPGPNDVSCSPKSMYRFADSANISKLKSMAKAAILKGLSELNIVTELFSVFTSRYREIIELEVDFLLKNFTEDVENQFDDMLQTVVMGGAPHCFEALAFAWRRLCGGGAEAAWSALRRHARPSAFSKPPRLGPTRVEIRKPGSSNTKGAEKPRGDWVDVAELAELKKGKAAKSSPLDAWSVDEDITNAKEAEEEVETVAAAATAETEVERLVKEEQERLEKEEEERIAREIAELEAAEAQAQAELKARMKGEKEAEEAVVRAKKEAQPAAAALNDPHVKVKKGKKGAVLNLWDDGEAEEKERIEQEMREAEEAAWEPAELKAAEEVKKVEEEAKAQVEKETEDWGFAVTKPKKGKRGEAKGSPLDVWGADEESAKADEERLAQEKADKEAREREEQKRAERERKGREEQERRQKEEQENAEKEKERPASGSGGGGSNSIFNFGGGGGGWGGFSSWGEKAKSKAPSIKTAIDSAWGTGSTFGNLGYGGGDSQLSPEELKLADVAGQATSNQNSLFDNWDAPQTSFSNFGASLLDAPAGDQAGDTGAAKGLPSVPHVSSKTPSRAPSKAPSRVASRASSPPPVLIPPVEAHAELTTEQAAETGENGPGGAGAAEEPAAGEGEEVQAANAEDEWAIPVKQKKGKKKGAAAVSDPSMPNPDGGEEKASGAGKKKKKKGGK